MLYKKNEDSFYESFNFIVPGYNLRPLEIEAAIGIMQIDKINEIIANRRENAELFIELFSNNKNITIQKEIGASSWFGFSMILKNEFEGKRVEIVKKLTANGIEVRPIVAGNFTRNEVIKYMDYEIAGKLKNADYIHENGFFIGNHSQKISDQIHYLYNVLQSTR